MAAMPTSDSFRELLRAVEGLPAAELEEFLRQVATIRARRQANALSELETDLVERINHPLPEGMLPRYRELIVARRAETLTPEEHGELLRLADTLEQINARRLGWLAELARLRGVSLVHLMAELGMKPQPYE